MDMLNAILTGLVAATVCGNVLPLGHSVVLGILSALAYKLGVRFEKWLGALRSVVSATTPS